MSGKIYKIERKKEFAFTYRFVDKENTCGTRSKSIESKNSARKKGLSLRPVNQKNDAATEARYSKITGIGVPFFLDNDEEKTGHRSRSRVRSDLHKSITANSSRKASEKQFLMKETLKDKKFNIPMVCTQVALHRARSESRNLWRRIQHPIRAASVDAKNRYLSNDVKRRTSISIQMWKDKMRKQRDNVGAVSKNLLSIHSKAINSDRSDINRNFQRSTSFLYVNNRSNKYRFASDEYLKNITPLDRPSMPLLTPTKVRYEKREVTSKPSTSNEDIDEIINSTSGDHFEDLVKMERDRDRYAPKLSPYFLRKNINAQQRKLIVGYLIRLGMHCCYPSDIIYQTVKLFDTAMDKMVVDTIHIQLVALTCLWIILKRDGTGDKIPSATKILRLAKDMYEGQEDCLPIYEKKISLALHFNMRFADPFTLLAYYIRQITQSSYVRDQMSKDDVRRIYFCSCYLIDLTMLDERLCSTPICVVVKAAIDLALYIGPQSNALDQTLWLQFFTDENSLTEWEKSEVNYVKESMLRLARESNKKSIEINSNIVYKKYLRSAHGNVSEFLIDQVDKLFLARNSNYSLLD